MMSLAMYEWVEGLQQLSTNIVRMHQDPVFWLDPHYLNLDLNRLKCVTIMIIKRVMRGDATRMETYIKIGELRSEYKN